MEPSLSDTFLDASALLGPQAGLAFILVLKWFGVAAPRQTTLTLFIVERPQGRNVWIKSNSIFMIVKVCEVI